MNTRLYNYANKKQEMLDIENDRVENILQKLKNNQATEREIFRNWRRLKVKLQFENYSLYNKAFEMYQDYRDLNC